MANDFKDLAPILLAIGRQIAGGKAGSCRSDRPERDLPILLLPNSRPSQVSADRRRVERDLPYLMIPEAPSESEKASAPAEPVFPPAPSRPERKEGAYLRLDPGSLGSPA
jgi:hypothetical protein